MEKTGKIRCVLLVNRSTSMKAYEEEVNKAVCTFINSWKSILSIDVSNDPFCYGHKLDASMELMVLSFDKCVYVECPMSNLVDIEIPRVKIGEASEANGNAAIWQGVLEVLSEADSIQKSCSKLIYLFSECSFTDNQYRDTVLKIIENEGITLVPMSISAEGACEEMRQYTPYGLGGIPGVELESLRASIPTKDLSHFIRTIVIEL